MKKHRWTAISYLGMLSFLLYWTAVLIIALPANKAQHIISAAAPRFKTMFGRSWKLFTPPYTYNNRLYFIVRNSDSPSRTDTIEVLENIASQKQRHAPFNQRENIIDHLVNNNVQGVVKTVWLNKKLPGAGMGVNTDSAYIAAQVAAVAQQENYLIFLGTLKNYCKVVLKEKKIDTARKEIKIQITQKMNRPYKEMHNPDYLPKEILVFQTPFEPLLP